VGLSTPAIFKALDLDRRSSADPLQLLQQMTQQAAITPELCVNDLEQPAFDNLPELAQLKQRLAVEGDGSFSAVFMTGSGSTIVCVGSDMAPRFLSDQEYQDLFISPARLIVRQPGSWYCHSSPKTAAPAAAAAAAAAV
jgi:4-diphosphocytidyl-2-C-methyl-D-erythritol kinase